MGGLDSILDSGFSEKIDEKCFNDGNKDKKVFNQSSICGNHCLNYSDSSL